MTLRNIKAIDLLIRFNLKHSIMNIHVSSKITISIEIHIHIKRKIKPQTKYLGSKDGYKMGELAKWCQLLFFSKQLS
jgi:hypothetical protein